MSPYEQDVLLGMSALSLNTSEKTKSLKKKEKVRVQARMKSFYYRHIQVSKKDFFYMMSIKNHRFHALTTCFHDCFSSIK